MARRAGLSRMHRASAGPEGKDRDLGAWGFAEAEKAYRELVGRHLLEQHTVDARLRERHDLITIPELLAAYLELVHHRYRAWRVVMLLDGDSSHTAKASQRRAVGDDGELVWLPKRSPHLKPMGCL